MAPPPVLTCLTTRSEEGLSLSRFGPTVPEAPAAFSVWQFLQPASENTFAPAVLPPPEEPPPDELEPPQPAATSATTATAATRRDTPATVPEGAAALHLATMRTQRALL